jgi:hypothetical protein
MTTPISLARARALLARGDRQGAAALLGAVVRRDPGSALAWRLLAEAVDTPEQRQYCLQRARAIDPDSADAPDLLPQRPEPNPQPPLEKPHQPGPVHLQSGPGESPGIVTLACSACGGSLRVSLDAERWTCEYCGREHLVRRQGTAVSLAPIERRLDDVQSGVAQANAELAAVKRELVRARLAAEIADLRQQKAALKPSEADIRQTEGNCASAGCLLVVCGVLAAVGAFALGNDPLGTWLVLGTVAAAAAGAGLAAVGLQDQRQPHVRLEELIAAKQRDLELVAAGRPVPSGERATVSAGREDPPARRAAAAQRPDPALDVPRWRLAAITDPNQARVNPAPSAVADRRAPARYRASRPAISRRVVIAGLTVVLVSLCCVWAGSQKQGPGGPAAGIAVPSQTSTVEAASTSTVASPSQTAQPTGTPSESLASAPRPPYETVCARLQTGQHGELVGEAVANWTGTIDRFSRGQPLVALPGGCFLVRLPLPVTGKSLGLVGSSLTFSGTVLAVSEPALGEFVVELGEIVVDGQTVPTLTPTDTAGPAPTLVPSATPSAVPPTRAPLQADQYGIRIGTTADDLLAVRGRPRHIETWGEDASGLIVSYHYSGMTYWLVRHTHDGLTAYRVTDIVPAGPYRTDECKRSHEQAHAAKLRTG